ncbi:MULTISPECIES: tRNA (uridine(34)/cytosine(34)/5-carboxymethylaminomethyluridine(34)-2'-O)-methyltransferase TrmL [Exiguobacterium]|uniref:Putative tRNA (cytidine(34)-2'-O)-methyltransferase n=1 Tax=Exiguobacterium sibiricum (strain DSM 17290 / CCUG 55495 / CIP 109462 / JCM 13490 / 255-15) TaxID=262543 RepID=B1YK64_EXIS2|nr:MULTISPECIES: tRNA (uridine(34)/cytosine(34)/5-carboxymethylaminomethyluridine(34)-2'-O)-methyltransferase TrmL [Exiguobacterium]ACB60145.1 RNA methyltransferase, TrmH family, group 2 [Exiguobacterium sibiricum 255-15]MCT4791919.1 tRNA (uridine(34)/cytosine(34)/5-carboxymethylaminomethyluridine(34)-2'-O)-methyltransferase TrmL [Exiguobacterium artemiae]MDX1259661.1 tRNA (uridine(34)/cytosine(34)/5-carboxymethylaminomethyluridine(34)-2'-O)-methyltransferase TrmL [Exiguobacterium sp. K1]
MAIHVVMYQPEIPQNTGNISRTCAATHSVLHLIRPLGFSTDDKQLKRAGLDYWEFVDVRYHDSLEELWDKHPDGTFYYITKYGEKYPSQVDLSNVEEDYFFVFGRETKGLPLNVIDENLERCIRLPQSNLVRSLNVSNTAAIIVYEALRQQGYANLL